MSTYYCFCLFVAVTGGSTFFGSRKAAFFVISWALGHRKSPLFSNKMANKPAAEVDIAVLIDGELRDLIRQRGLEIPRKATRPDLVALLRTSLDEDKEVSEPTSTSPLAANEGVVASLCSALSELTNVVRELKTELHAMREIEAKFNDSAREVLCLKTQVRELRNDLHAKVERYDTVIQTLNNDPTEPSFTKTVSSTPQHRPTYAETLHQQPALQPKNTAPAAAPAAQRPQRQPPKPYRRQESSRWLAPKLPKSTTRCALTGKPRVKVFYVGNVDPECDASPCAKPLSSLFFICNRGKNRGAKR